MQSDDRILTRNEVADLLRVTRNALDRMGMRDQGPPYFRVGRSIRYRQSAVDRWAADQQARSVEQPYAG